MTKLARVNWLKDSLSHLLSRWGEKRKIGSVLPGAAPSHAVVYTIGTSSPATVTHAISCSPGAQNPAAGHVLKCSFALSGANTPSECAQIASNRTKSPYPISGVN